MFFTPFLITALLYGSLGIIFENFVTTVTANIPAPGAPVEEIQNWFWSFILTFLAIASVMGIISWIIGTVVNGVCVKCAADVIERGKAVLGEALNYAVYKIFSLLAAALVTAILIGLGFIALIVPGIILLVMFSLVVPAIIIEDIGALESLSRSRRLVSRRWLKTFILLLIVYLAVLFTSYVGRLIGQPLGLFNVIVSNVTAAFVQPIIPISITVYYYAMLAKEAQRVPPPPPPPF
ncbi:MAG: hypothetical protein QXJ63_00160 [Candidatus Bathyarchaeia archaeon]